MFRPKAVSYCRKSAGAIAGGALLAGLLSWSCAASEVAARILVDADFAPVASDLARSFASTSGHRLVLTVLRDPAQGQIDPAAHLFLAPDTESAEALETAGLTVPGGLDYARARKGQLDGPLRRAVLLPPGLHSPAATAFLAYLSTPEAWDVIVRHGFGSY